MIGCLILVLLKHSGGRCSSYTPERGGDKELELIICLGPVTHRVPDGPCDDYHAEDLEGSACQVMNRSHAPNPTLWRILDTQQGLGQEGRNERWEEGRAP